MKCGGPCALVKPPEMDHNSFDFIKDLITPFSSFLKQSSISVAFSPASLKQETARSSSNRESNKEKASGIANGEI